MPEASSQPLAQSYDDIPYRGQPFRQTHPQWISAVAQLLGLSAPSSQRCRVLELGCCDGGNLIPMAAQLPESTFVGVDYSAVQIEMARTTVEQLGLKNLDLRALSILDITPDWGSFDYIICHGVFSWVPVEVQQQILEVCSKNLSPDGIAYISYNANPGWHLRGIVRDMMRYHAMRFETPERRLQEARLILDFVSQHGGGVNKEAYLGFLRAEVALLKRAPDHYLYHEHLEENLKPFYFHEFVALAEQHGLAYLAESRLGSMAPSNFGPVAERALSAIATNLVELEQFMDFLSNRTFRETLLHHPGREPNYAIEPKRLEGLFLSSALRPQSKSVDLRPDIPVPFEGPAKNVLTINHSLLKAALLCMANEFPRAISLEALVDRAREQLSKVKVKIAEDRSRDAGQLAAALLTLLTTSDALEVTAAPSAFTLGIAERPRASAVARLQAKETDAITTLRHDTTKLGEKDRAVLMKLDGMRTVAEIATSLGATEADVREIVQRLARCALLVEKAGC